MFDAPLTFGEFVSNSLALHEISRCVFEYLRTRSDVVLFGAYAVNVYASPERMTEDIDIMSTDAEGIANELRGVLAKRFHVAVRVRSAASGRGFRVYQVRKPKNRHLVDVRQVAALPKTNRVGNIRVVIPSDLIVMKLESYVARRHTEKGLTDRLDVYRLLRAFPQFRSEDKGPVAEKLVGTGPLEKAWLDIIETPLEESNDDEY